MCAFAVCECAFTVHESECVFLHFCSQAHRCHQGCAGKLWSYNVVLGVSTAESVSQRVCLSVSDSGCRRAVCDCE